VTPEKKNDLGPCGTVNNGVIIEYKKAFYICRDSVWGNATTLDLDTYGFNGVEGDVKTGLINKDMYYVYENGTWRATTNEQEITFGACVASREGVKQSSKKKYFICENKSWKEISVVEYSLEKCISSKEGSVEELDGVFYICKSNTWEIATALEYDTYGWDAGTEGEVRTGNENTDKYYVFENGTWRVSANEIEENLGACVASRNGELGKVDDIYYICKLNIWETATVLEYDTYGKICLMDGSIIAGEVETSNKYVCDAGTFRAATEQEMSLNKGCVSYTENDEIRRQISESQDSVYTCKKGLWLESIGNHIVYGTLTDTRDGKVYKTVIIGSQTWMKENLNYSDSVNYPSLLNRSWCYNNLKSNCEKNGRLYNWAVAMDSAGVWSTNAKGCGNKSVCQQTYPVRGICPEGWHLPAKDEFETLIKTVGGGSLDVTNNAGKVLKSTSGWNGNGSDAYGFSALATGIYFEDSHRFDYGGSFTCFWSSTDILTTTSSHISLTAYDMGLDLYRSDAFVGGSAEKNQGHSVRCLKD
jgi:uncharacterized protein (TIGR02145 family)